MAEPLGTAQPGLLGPHWGELRFKQLGWQLLPLRGFLGVTFAYASLQKLANPNYFHASSPSSFVSQTRALEATSPIAPVLRLSLHAPGLFALLIALGELAVGLGILAGLWTRAAAVGGVLLSLTFFLTVSWSTTPYFYGSDIVFVFAWTVFALCGAGGVLCVDAWIAARAETVPRSPGTVDPVRRHLVVGARSAALLAVIGGVLGGATALVGRAAGGTRRGALSGPQLNPVTPDPTASGGSSPAPARHRRSKPLPGTSLGPANAVPVGEGRQFTDPATGRPAWLLRPSAAKVTAFSAVCTHAGCTVSYESSSNEFVCPCHGGRYDASTGAVLGGPPSSPLTRIRAEVVNDEIRVD